MYRPGRAQPPRRPLLPSSLPRRTQPPRAGTSTRAAAMEAPINKIARLPSNNSPPVKLAFFFVFIFSDFVVYNLNAP